MASDEDTTPFFFAILGELDDNFEIDANTGVIVTVGPLDYEQRREYLDLVLVVYDVDFMSNATFHIMIGDENDNSPTFVNATAQISIPELISTGSEIYTAVATDVDDTTNSQLTYLIEGSDDFIINPLSGAVTVEEELDFEVQQNYVLTITATDGGSPAMSSSMTLSVVVIDENDNQPSITTPLPMYRVIENVPIGVLVGGVNATDADSGVNAMLSFTISGGNEANRFSINSETGEIFTNGNIDREEQSTYNLVVEVSNLCFVSLEP